MPSSLNRSGPRQRAGRVFSNSLRGQRYVPTPMIEITIPVAAANFSGANSGIWAWIAPFAVEFLGAEAIWATAGTNTVRVKKVKSAATSAPGAAADANNVDISTTFDLTQAANVRREATPVITGGANILAQGDKVALASAAGTTGLAGGVVVLYFGAI